MPDIDTYIFNIMPMLIDKRKQLTQTAYDCGTENFKHICAILDKDGTILAIGYNTYHVNQRDTEHAEVMAMRKFLEKLKALRIIRTKRYEVNLFVMRTNCKSSKPCENCINTMESYTKWFSIKNVYYTDDTTASGIRKMKLRELVDDPNKHLSAFHRFKLLNELQNKQFQTYQEISCT